MIQQLVVALSGGLSRQELVRAVTEGVAARAGGAVRATVGTGYNGVPVGTLLLEVLE